MKKCDGQVATLADYEKVYSSGNCRNALLAQKEIQKMRNNPKNPGRINVPVLVFDKEKGELVTKE